MWFYLKKNMWKCMKKSSICVSQLKFLPLWMLYTSIIFSVILLYIVFLRSFCLLCVGAYFCLYSTQLRAWLQNHSSSTNLFISRNSHSTKMKNPQQEQITSKEHRLTGTRASNHAFSLRMYKVNVHCTVYIWLKDTKWTRNYDSFKFILWTHYLIRQHFQSFTVKILHFK